MRLLYLTLLLACSSFWSWSQKSEKAPLKTFHFEVGVSHLKSQIQVDQVVSIFSKIEGVQNLQFKLIDYQLSFDCTNHDMNDHAIIDRLKMILSQNGVQIDQLTRKNQ